MNASTAAYPVGSPELRLRLADAIDSTWRHSWHWHLTPGGRLTLEGLRKAAQDCEVEIGRAYERLAGLYDAADTIARIRHEEEDLMHDPVSIGRDDLGTLLVSAVRYALGRATYITGVTADLVVAHAARVEPPHLREVMARDIREALERGHAGWECDAREWRRALEHLESLRDERPAPPAEDLF